MRVCRARATFALFVVCFSFFTLGCGREPGQILARWTLEVPGAAPRPIELPARLRLPDRILKYRLTATVDLDRAIVGHDVALVVPYLPAFASLRVNGRDVRLADDPGPAAAYGGSAPRRWLLPASATDGGAPVKLELEVTHSWTPSARIGVPPELVAAGEVSPRAERVRLLNRQGAWFGLIALSQVGMTFLAVYFWDRRRRAYLWFAIQALTASYYPAYIAGLPALWLGWRTQNTLLAQSLAVGPIISVYFTNAFFDLPPPSRAWLALLGVAMFSPVIVLAASVVTGTGFLVISYSAVIVVVCVVAAIAYQLVTGVRLLRTYPDRGTVVFFLCCWIALAGSSWVDLLAWTGGPEVLSGGRPACVGLGLFGIFQSMLLSRSHFRSLVEADRLNLRLRGQVRDLEERQAEIGSLNDELQRQIGRRTADVLAALTESDGELAVPLRPGDTVDGRYRLVAPLGVGGMGTVYEVERLSDGRRLALKVAQEVRGLALARLAREARIATQVHHPNVVSVVDADVAQGGYAYLVMELVEGRTLAACGKGHDAPWCLRVLLQILEGTRALHAQGIIHRDLKPSNVLVADDETALPRVKVTDFGISRWIDEGPLEAAALRPAASAEDATVDHRGASVPPAPSRPGAPSDPRSTPQLTRTGQISGTPAYVAPELAGGTTLLSPAVDVFSFGVVAYGLLTGKPPFVEPPFLARLDGHDVTLPAPLAAACPAIGADLARAVDACLALAPDARPAVDALVALVQGELARAAPAHRAGAARPSL